jgi:hypothetical protein
MGDHPRVSGSLRQISSFPKVGISFYRPVGYPAVDAIGYQQIRQHGVANVETLGQLESLGVEAAGLASTLEGLQPCQLVQGVYGICTRFGLQHNESSVEVFACLTVPTFKA